MNEYYGYSEPWPGSNGLYPRANPTLYQRPRRIDRVHGREGVDRFNMGPNEEVAVLDETAPILWVIKTDSAGYKVPTPFEIRPYQPEPAVDLRDLAERVKRMEDAIYAKPGAGGTSKAGTAEATNP